MGQNLGSCIESYIAHASDSDFDTPLATGERGSTKWKGVFETRANKKPYDSAESDCRLRVPKLANLDVGLIFSDPDQE